MTTKISDLIIVQSVINYINNGLSESEIYNKNIGRKPIRRIAMENNLIEKLKINNKIYKRRVLENYAKNRHLIECKNLDVIYGERVCELIINGGILTDVFKIMNSVPQKQVMRFLKYKNIDDLRRKNSSEYISKAARVNGAKSALTLSNKELKPITVEIAKRFEILKRTLIYKQRVYDAIRNEFGFGEKKIRQLCERYGYPLDNPQTGELNPMYGKSPSNKSGIGVKCWVLSNGMKYFCRSSLELRVICYFIDKNIPFQISKHRIPYVDDNGHKRTYCPDIVITDNNEMIPHLYEIKPHMMTFIRCNVIKSNAAKEYCKKFGMVYGWFITEKRLDLIKYNLQYIINMINNKAVIIDNKNLEKLKRNII